MRRQSTGQFQWRVAPPAVPSGFLRRVRLDDRLSLGARRGITVVTGGVGSGKTLTLASWAQAQHTARVAWLTLDEGDNSLQAFWSDVLRALAVNGAVPPESRLRQVVPASSFGAREETLIRSALAALQHPVVLVLDEFQRVTERSVLDSLSRLLEHRLPTLRIVLGTRADPALRLHRLRLSGEVTEVRSASLAFTPTEAAALFALNGITLSRAQLDGVLSRTQGWAAGLRLALMCLDPADLDESLAHFTGSERLVAEYLIEEVLDRLPASDCELLMATSVVERVSGELADVLTGRDDGQFTLERLTAQNALVVGLGGRNEWFAVHPLLRDLLLHRLALERPTEVARLRMLAAGWFEDKGEPIPAIRQAAEAGRWDDVGRLLTELAAPAIVTAQAPLLVSALRPAADRAQLFPTTSTLLGSAISHFHRHDYDSMMRDVQDAGALIDEVPREDRPAAAALINLLRITYARSYRPARLLHLCTDLLGDLDQVSRRHMPAREHYRLIATNNLGVAQLWGGDFGAARTTLSAVEFRCTPLGVGLTALSAQGYLALIDAIEGDHQRAHRRATAARDVAGRRGWTREPQAQALYAALAMTALERGRLEDAQAAINEGTQMTGTGSDAGCRLILCIVDVGVAAARHDPDAALMACSRLAVIRDGIGKLPELLSRWCGVARADAALIRGDAAGAIAAIGDPPAGFPESLERIALAKARLLLHQPDLALEVLQPVDGPSHACPAQVVEARILEALAAEHLHCETAALGAITQAVDMASEADLVRPFLTAGPRVAALLQRQRHIVATHLDFTRQFCAVDRNRVEPISPAATSQALTERELAVLRYLPTMFKAAEIATDLFVTVNTVKSHQQSIYRKLDVRTRREAVDRARQLHLI